MFLSFKKYKKLLEKVSIDPSKYSGVICPLRGGAFVADPISRKYDLPIHYIHLHSYNGKTQKEMVLETSCSLEDNKYYLICDDIYATGGTIKFIEELYPNCFFDVFCLFSTEKEGLMYGEYVKKGVWVDYWWEIPQ